MIKRFGTDIFYHPVGDLVVDVVHKPLGQCRNGDDNRDLAKDRKESGKIHMPRTQDQVHALSHQDRRVQGGGHRHGSQDKRQDYHPFVASNVVQDPL